MVLTIDKTKINYVRYGNSLGKTIVLLHGWGQNIQMMKPLGDPFSDDFDIVIVDLPGFGESSEPSSIWTIIDYADAIHKLLEKLNVKKPIMIGHSFGGKISLEYASKYDTEKLILLGSPFKKTAKDNSLKTKTLKSLKKIPGLNKLEEFAKKHIGSTDYKNASPLMREVLVNHVNLDITEDVKKISCPTIIIWGDMDEAVPLEIAYELESLIKDAAVVLYEGCTHYAYLERLGQTISVVSSFIRS